MKKLLSATAFALCATLFSPFGAKAEDSWNLIFEDNFDGTTLDRTNWKVCPRLSSDWNKYLVDSEENIFVEDGCLNLRATVNTDATDNVPYHTAGVKTQGFHGITYGKVEVRAKTKKGKGNFPAIWMMPTNGTGGWPACGEIDIMEQINTESKVYMTIHSKYHNQLGYTTPSKGGTFSLDPEVFHVYALQKYKDRMEWYIDGELQFTYSDKGLDSSLAQWPFDKEFYLILDQACGGSWVGTPDPNVFPLTTVFDYVRMYELAPSGIDGTNADAAPLASIVRNNGSLTISPAQNASRMRVFLADGRMVYNGAAQDISLPLPNAIAIIEITGINGNVEHYKK